MILTNVLNHNEFQVDIQSQYMFYIHKMHIAHLSQKILEYFYIRIINIAILTMSGKKHSKNVFQADVQLLNNLRIPIILRLWIQDLRHNFLDHHFHNFSFCSFKTRYVF